MELEGKKRYNQKHDIWKKLAMSSIVLLYNTLCKKDILQNVAFKWLGFYKIYNAIGEKKIYMLKKLNGLYLTGIFLRNCLKKFDLC